MLNKERARVRAMQKFLLRLLAILLVPTLVMDPAFAVAHFQPRPTFTIRSATLLQTRPQEEALSARAWLSGRGVIEAFVPHGLRSLFQSVRLPKGISQYNFNIFKGLLAVRGAILTLKVSGFYIAAAIPKRFVAWLKSLEGQNRTDVNETPSSRRPALVQWIGLVVGGTIASYFVNVRFLGGQPPAHFATLDLFLSNITLLFVLVLAEELMFRSGVYEALRQRMNSRLNAIFVQAVIFAAGHYLYHLIPLSFFNVYPLESIPFLLMLGVILGFAYEVAGLGGSLITHFAVNIAGNLLPDYSLGWKLVYVLVTVLVLNSAGVLDGQFTSRERAQTASVSSIAITETPSGGYWIWLRDLVTGWISHETYRRWSILVEFAVSSLYGLKSAHDYISMSFRPDPYDKLGAFFNGTLFAYLAIHLVDIVRNLINHRVRWLFILANTSMALGIFSACVISLGIVSGTLGGVVLGLGVFVATYYMRTWILRRMFKPQGPGNMNLGHNGSTESGPRADRGDINFRPVDGENNHLKRALLLAVSIVVLALTTAYGALRVQESGFSFKYAFETPSPMPQIERPISIPSSVVIATQRADQVIRDGSANREFWQAIATTLPRNVAVSSIVTMERVRTLSEAGQLDSLFNGLRTQPDVLYRYLSEIPESQAIEFSRYFATMKPGTRQKVFEIFYHRIRHDFEVLESAAALKRILMPSRYSAYLNQKLRMKHLYGTMAQMLNGSGAPFPILSFTKNQAIDNFTNLFKSAIAIYRQRGYEIVLPDPQLMNSADIVGLIGYPRDGDQANLFFADNKAALLLEWVLKTSKPGGHLVDDSEILNKAMELYADPQTKTVDLFKVLATVGHYYKGMARQPNLILGGPEARATRSGVRYMLDHHDRLNLIWSLDPKNRFTVDDTGRPVIRWRNVDADGNDTIPKGETGGIIWPSIEADLYHSYNYWLTIFYIRQESFSHLNRDWNDFYREHSRILIEPAHGLHSQPWRATITQLRAAYDVWEHKGYQVKQDALLALKLADRVGFHDLVVMQTRFSIAGTGRSKERTKIVMAHVVENITNSMVKPGDITFAPSNERLIFNEADAHTVEGGRSTIQYRDSIIAEWRTLGRPTPLQWAQRDPRRFWEVVVAAEQIENLQQQVPERSFPFRSKKIEQMVIDGQFGVMSFVQFGPLEWKQRIRLNTSSSGLLAALANDADDAVRANVAHNAATPADTLAKLASDKDSYVREGVAANPSTPSSILVTLSLDRSSNVRENLAGNGRPFAGNPNAPLAALIEVALQHTPGTQASYYIQDRIQEKYGELGAKIFQAARADLAAKNQLQIDPTTLTRLGATDPLIRQALAKPNALWEQIRPSGDVSRDVEIMIALVRKLVENVIVVAPTKSYHPMRASLRNRRRARGEPYLNRAA